MRRIVRFLAYLWALPGSVAGSLLAIVGPLRMNYSRSFALLRQAKRLLGGSE